MFLMIIVWVKCRLLSAYFFTYWGGSTIMPIRSAFSGTVMEISPFSSEAGGKMIETFSRGTVNISWTKMSTGVRPDVAFALTVRSRRGARRRVQVRQVPDIGIQNPVEMLSYT